MHRIITTVGFATLLVTTALASAAEVKGRVLADDRPVAGARVSTYWTFDGVAPQPSDPLVTNEQGAFSGEIRYYDRPTLLLAYDADSSRGGTAIVGPDTDLENVRIELGPLVEFDGTITSEGLGHAPEWTNVYMSLMPGRLRVASCSSREATFSFRLPPGTYELWAYGTDLQSHRREVVLERAAVDLGAIDIEPSIIAQHYGKAPPKWNVTDARGAKVGIQPSAYKGKWMLLEFWGYW